jgi:hypothetical protein
VGGTHVEIVSCKDQSADPCDPGGRLADLNSLMAAPAFSTTIDIARNRARTQFGGRLTGVEMGAAAAELESIVIKLRPGFVLFADFGAVTSMEFDCVPHLTRIMDILRAHGMGAVVRILPARASDIGINLLSMVHYRGEIKTITVETLDEAERVLAVL